MRVDKLKNRKAAGTDEITGEIIKDKSLFHISKK